MGFLDSLKDRLSSNEEEEFERAFRDGQWPQGLEEYIPMGTVSDVVDPAAAAPAYEAPSPGAGAPMGAPMTPVMGAPAVGSPAVVSDYAAPVNVMGMESGAVHPVPLRRPGAAHDAAPFSIANSAARRRTADGREVASGLTGAYEPVDPGKPADQQGRSCVQQAPVDRPVAVNRPAPMPQTVGAIRSRAASQQAPEPVDAFPSMGDLDHDERAMGDPFEFVGSPTPRSERAAAPAVRAPRPAPRTQDQMTPPATGSRASSERPYHAPAEVAPAQPRSYRMPAEPTPVPARPQRRDDAPVMPVAINAPVPRGNSMVASLMQVVRPHSYDDVSVIARALKEQRKNVIIVLRGASGETTRRILDFSFGLCCGMGATMREIDDRVFVVQPKGAQLTNEDLKYLREQGIVKE